MSVTAVSNSLILGGWVTKVLKQYFDFFVSLCSIKMPLSCLFLIAFVCSFNQRNWLHAFETEQKLIIVSYF